MTRMAREVLCDCRLALNMLEEEIDTDRWRVLWAGSVALLRTVGHVLHKVDGRHAKIAPHQKAAFARWKTGPEHAIFREFIDQERNNIVKEYRSSVHPYKDVPVAVELTVEHPETGEQRLIRYLGEFPETTYRPLLEGYGEGEDAREVYSEAIAWWDSELSAIERCAGEHMNVGGDGGGPEHGEP